MMKKSLLTITIVSVFAVLILFAVIQITGCGGSSGDSSTAMTPEELEVATAVESFAAAVKSENINNAKVFLDTNLKYYRTGGLTEDYLKFIKRLEDLFSAATVSDFRIDSLGVTLNSETLAEARGQLELSYINNLGVAQYQSESIKMSFERSPGGVWGIIEFARYSASDQGSIFPPAL